jgi:methionyl-tRNA formyltransferase
MTRERVLLLTESTKWGDLASDLMKTIAAEVHHIPWSWGEDRSNLDATLASWRGGAIVCFKADCIVPTATLHSTAIALNFHPGPPWLRGVACPERAVRRGDRAYGVTCHFMIEEVDAGKIIALDTFSVPPEVTVPALRERVGAAMLSQLDRVWQGIGTLRLDGNRDEIWASELVTVRQARREGLM